MMTRLPKSSDLCKKVSATNYTKALAMLHFLLAAGAVSSPFDCYLANRGLKTLHVRMRQHEQNAIAVAHFLQSSPHVEETIYPGELESLILILIL